MVMLINAGERILGLERPRPFRGPLTALLKYCH